jgi:hypothetical protein
MCMQPQLNERAAAVTRYKKQMDVIDFKNGRIRTNVNAVRAAEVTYFDVRALCYIIPVCYQRNGPQRGGLFLGYLDD